MTSAIFGREGIDVRCVTTARYMVPEQEPWECPQSDGILALDPGARGVPEVPHAG